MEISKNVTALIVISLLVVIFLGYSPYFFADNFGILDFVKTFTTIISGLGILSAFFLLYVSINANKQASQANKETAQANKETAQANEFLTIFSIHNKMSSQESYLMRRYLHRDFPKELADVVGKLFGNEYIEGEGHGRHINTEKILNSWKGNDKTLNDFQTKLKTLGVTEPLLGGISPLDVVERVLLDFDFIAIPFSKKIKVVEFVALTYKEVLKNTASKILPFIAIQRKLRENNYKDHYIYLLKSLGIDTQTLEVVRKENFLEMTVLG